MRGVVHSVSSFEVASGKTKDAVAAIHEITDAVSVIIIGKSFSEETRPRRGKFNLGQTAKPLRTSTWKNSYCGVMSSLLMMLLKPSLNAPPKPFSKP